MHTWSPIIGWQFQSWNERLFSWREGKDEVGVGGFCHLVLFLIVAQSVLWSSLLSWQVRDWNAKPLNGLSFPISHLIFPNQHSTSPPANGTLSPAPSGSLISRQQIPAQVPFNSHPTGTGNEKGHVGWSPFPFTKPLYLSLSVPFYWSCTVHRSHITFMIVQSYNYAVHFIIVVNLNYFSPSKLYLWRIKAF